MRTVSIKKISKSMNDRMWIRRSSGRSYKYDEYPIHRFLLAIERVFSLYEWRGIRGEAAIVDESHNVK